MSLLQQGDYWGIFPAMIANSTKKKKLLLLHSKAPTTLIQGSKTSHANDVATKDTVRKCAKKSTVKKERNYQPKKQSNQQSTSVFVLKLELPFDSEKKKERVKMKLLLLITLHSLRRRSN